MNYLFWNTNKNKNINTLLVDLIKSYNCEVLALAEYEDDVINLQKKLDIQKSEKKLITLIKKLTKEKSKEINKIKRDIELKSFEN